MKKVLIPFMFLLSVAFISSCSKEGPAGAAGPAGPAGAAGAAGATGPAGPAGTANVIYSDWFNFAKTDWKDTTLFVEGGGGGVGVARAIKLAPSITATHLSSAVILSYMAYKPATSQSFLASLPFITDVNSDNFQINFMPITGKMMFYWLYSGDNNTHGDKAADYPITSDYYFRYVIIPGGVKASGVVGNTGLTLSELKALSYAEIQKLLKLPNSGVGSITMN